MLEVEKSIETSLDESDVWAKGCLIQHFLRHCKLNSFEDDIIVEYFAVFDLSHQSFNVKLGDPDELFGQLLQKSYFFFFFFNICQTFNFSLNSFEKF